MARSEAPASAKAAGNSYPLCLPPPRQSSTLHESGRYPKVWEERMEQVRELDGERAYEKMCRAVERARQPLTTSQFSSRRGPKRGGPERDYGRAARSLGCSFLRGYFASL